MFFFFFFFSSRRRHARSYGDWSSDVCSSDLGLGEVGRAPVAGGGVAVGVQGGDRGAEGHARGGAGRGGHRVVGGVVGRHVDRRRAGDRRRRDGVRSEERRVGKGGEAGGGRDR